MTTSWSGRSVMNCVKIRIDIELLLQYRATVIRNTLLIFIRLVFVVVLAKICAKHSLESQTDVTIGDSFG